MYQRILVPVDGSETAGRGLAEAIGIARAHGATLRLLHVVTTLPWMVEMAAVTSVDDLHAELRRGGEQILAAAAARAQAEGVPAETVLRDVAGGRAAETIVEEAGTAACGLIVMGTHGRRGFSHLVLGSDAEAVLRASPVPVLLVRGAAATG